MTKRKLIEKIKSSLQADVLNIGEDTFNDCPIHLILTPNLVHLIETIYRDCVECTYYVYDTAVKTYKIQFEEISKKNLELVLENIEQANNFLEN